MSNPLIKFINRTVTNTVSSLVAGELKKHARKYLDAATERSDSSVKEELRRRLGYETQHYNLDKKGDIKLKSSPLFIHEWLTESPNLKGKISKDEENGEIYFEGTVISNWLRRDLMSKFQIATGIQTPALESHFKGAYNLLDVQDFVAQRFRTELNGWDGRPIIDVWLSSCFGRALQSDQKYASMLFRKWMIGTARRAMSPGAPLDGCMIFQGPAGVGKTNFFRQLLPEPFDKMTGEIYADVRNPQKFLESIVGKRIACFDELSVLENEKSDETFKQLLSSQTIEVRMVWAEKARSYALRQGFAGTKNHQKFIRDHHMSRRLWVVELNGSQRLDFEFLHRYRKELWQEAVHCALQGESSILTPEEQLLVEENNKKHWL